MANSYRHLCHYKENQWKALCRITAQTSKSMAAVIRDLIADGLKYRAFHNDIKDSTAEEALMLWLKLDDQN